MRAGRRRCLRMFEPYADTGRVGIDGGDDLARRGRAVAALASCMVTLCFGSSALGSPALTVTITSAPPSRSTSADATFAFSANEAATLACSLDGGKPAECRSPKSYTGLADGQHFFVVVATNSDRAGHTFSARDSHRWQIDLPDSPPPPPPPPPAPPPPSLVAPLVVSVLGAGSVASMPAGIACPGDCVELYAVGARVSLAPSVAAGFAFAGWSGACSGTGACTPTIGAGPTYVQARFSSVVASPARVRSDLDLDGVADASDGCPETARRAKPLHAGCALGDLLRDDGALLDPLALAVGKARVGLGAITGLGSVVRGLGSALTLIRAGALDFGHGDVCGGAKTMRRGARALEAASKQAGKLIAARENAITKSASPGADAGEKDFEWAGLHYRRGLVAEAAGAAMSVQKVVGGACAGLGKRVVMIGRVKSASSAHTQIELGDGAAVELAGEKYGVGQGSDGIWESERVRVVARKSRTGGWVAESTTGLEKAGDQPTLAPVQCVSLLIAPAQDFTKPNLILHDPAGYRSPSLGYDDLLWLESGMRLAASPVKALPTCTSHKGRWSLEIKLGGGTIAPDLDSADPPVPVDFGNFVPVLTVNERFQGSNCRPSLSPAGKATPAAAKPFLCPPVHVATTTYHLIMKSPGFYATAAYGGTVFHDPDQGALQFTTVTGFSSFDATIKSSAFQADGYKQVGNGSTAGLVTVGQGESFAIRPDSWYGGPLLFPIDTIGVDHIAGLLWPRVVGKRNGKPFRYRAKLPNLVTDLLPGCPANNCFYRLPWLFPGVVAVAQGNGPGAFSHNGAQQYAFDFSMPDKSTIYATRGGIVGDLVESNTMNFNPCADNNGNGVAGDDEDKKADGPTNYVRVDHLDGTYSYYAHVDANSVTPDVGDTVARGDPLAKVDNIGRSCGPHLHYQVAVDKTKTIYGQTKQICFESWTAVLVSFFYSPCAVPKTSNLLLSSNG